MKRFKPHIIGLAIVSLWGVLAYSLIGAEYDGSIADILVTLHLVFFIPGLALMDLVKGSHSDADLPLMAVFGWVVFNILFILIIESIRAIRGSKGGSQ
jgi:uncharacterized membrane protein YjjP (DUF1212 family)